MDTGIDFIQPEFLDILFFKQKNLVIFPYVDLKHLHFLELFTIGYNVVDLESTALHNLKDILEFENNNDYSQNPTIFFISNVDKQKIKMIMELNDIHCVINSNEKKDLSELVNGNSFIFYNKKSNQFLNYNYNSNSNLEFEKLLISTSKNKEILQDKIQKIKMTATKIFTELNHEEKPDLPAILKEYEKKYWQQIIDYTGLYYDIEVPEIQHDSIHNTSIGVKTNELRGDFSEEYKTIVSTHKPIGKEFILLIHEYRRKKVNPSHLELEELFNPQELYNYLRNRYWKSGIPEEFIRQWAQMKMSGYQFDEHEKEEFENILKVLNIDVSKTQKPKPYQQILKKQREQTSNSIKVVPQVNLSEPIPSVKKEWPLFKEWLETKISTLEKLINTLTP